MGWKTLDDMQLADKRVLVRVDINVPFRDGQVADDARIRRIVPTIRDILAMRGKPILLAHFGRPKGEYVAQLSLRPLVPVLQTAFGVAVSFSADCRGPGAGAAVAALRPGQVLLLENTRFHPGESANDPGFAAQIAALGDVYCNDAFSAAHRAHASTEALAHLLPACAGRLMQSELDALETALGTPERPVMAIVGGAKVSSKLALLGNLLEKVDTLVIGGGMANTFLAAQGVNVGTSLCEHEMADTARAILAKAKNTGCRIVLPGDLVVARDFRRDAQHRTVALDACPDDAMILDAGPDTVTAINTILGDTATVIMNGPLGVFEMAPFHKATFAVLDQIARLTKAGGLVSVAGGGDTVAAINLARHGRDFTYVSTAGGAFLEWMEGKTLPGVAALEK